MRTEGLTFEAHEIGATFRTLGRTVSETDIVTYRHRVQNQRAELVLEATVQRMIRRAGR